MADWQPLADSDPIPGDPGAIQGIATDLEDTAARIREQAQRLRQADSGVEWVGKAGDVFREHIGELPDQLDLVERRYQRTGDALGRYWPKLDEAQEMARRARDQAQRAQDDIGSAERGLEEIEDFERHAADSADAYNQAHPDEFPRFPDQWNGPDYGARLQTAKAELDDARSLLERAIGIRDDAARAAASAIGRATEDDLKDNLYQKYIGRHITENIPDPLAFITEVLDEVSGWLADIALALGAIAAVLTLTGVGAPVAAVLAGVALGLGTVALVAQGLSLAGRTALAVQGRVPWSDAAIAGGLFLVSLATLGIGGRIGGRLFGKRISNLTRSQKALTRQQKRFNTRAMPRSQGGAGRPGDAARADQYGRRVAGRQNEIKNLRTIPNSAIDSAVSHGADLRPGDYWDPADYQRFQFDQALRHDLRHDYGAAR